MHSLRRTIAGVAAGAVVLTMLIALGTCSRKASSPASTRLRLSMIPTTDPGKIIRESAPFVSYLEKETGAKVELTVPTNYAAVVEAIRNDQVDIAYLGGFTYVQASARSGVKPLVQREQDQNFHSVFITQPGSRIDALTDLRGHTFAFGDVNSTSGHLMPEYYMREAEVDPEVMSRAVYTGGHDATALVVANRKIDAGAMDELVFARMLQQGKITKHQVRVFYTTPPFYDYVWASRKDLDPKLADTFIAVMLKLAPNDPQQKLVLDLLGATRYVRANDSSYDKLRQAAKSAGLMK